MSNQGKSPEFNIEETTRIKQTFFGHFSNSRRLWVSSTSGFFRDPQCVRTVCVCVLWWTGDHGRVYSCLPPSQCWESLQHRHDPDLKQRAVNRKQQKGVDFLMSKDPTDCWRTSTSSQEVVNLFWHLLKLQSRACATHSTQPLRLPRWRVEGISDRGIRTRSLKFISLSTAVLRGVTVGSESIRWGAGRSEAEKGGINLNFSGVCLIEKSSRFPLPVFSVLFHTRFAKEANEGSVNRRCCLNKVKPWSFFFKSLCKYLVLKWAKPDIIVLPEVLKLTANFPFWIKYWSLLSLVSVRRWLRTRTFQKADIGPTVSFCQDFDCS